MLRLAARGIKPRLITSISAAVIAKSSCQRIAPAAARATQKYLSQSQQCHKKFTIANPDEFDKKVINGVNPVIVNFHAEWCAPCKLLTPKLIELFENSNEIDLAIIDVDANFELVEAIKLKAVPAIVAYRKGKVVDKFIGLVDSNSIENLIGKLKSNNDENADTTPAKHTTDSESTKKKK